MDWKMVRFEEGTDFDRDKKAFIRFKRAVFEVSGTEHTIRISMRDFNDGKSRSIIEAEVNRISEVLGGVGSGSRKKE